MYEAIGIIATLFVLSSFLANGEKKIRKINIFGAILFVVYGVLIGALSVWLLTGAWLLIHAFKLNKL